MLGFYYFLLFSAVGSIIPLFLSLQFNPTEYLYTENRTMSTTATTSPAPVPAPTTPAPQVLPEDVIKTPTETSKPVNQTVAQIRSLIAGGVGGVCAVVVGHPFDLVKVRLQTAEKGIYSGAIDCVKKTIAREGLARVCLLVWRW